MRIPIKALKIMAQHLKLTHIIVFAYDGKAQHVATYGKTVDGCAQAADFGNKLKDQLGWPESLHAEPARVRELKQTVKDQDKRIQRLREIIGSFPGLNCDSNDIVRWQKQAKEEAA